MSFNALNLNQSADIQSAFLGSAIEEAANHVCQTNGFIPLPPKPSVYFSDNAHVDLEAVERDQKRVEQLEHARRVLSLAEGSEATEDYRLVKKCKSPTRSEKEAARRLVLESQGTMLAFVKRGNEAVANHKKLLEKTSTPFELPKYNVKNELHEVSLLRGVDGGLDLVNHSTGEIGAVKLPIGQRGAVARISVRDWSGEARIRVCAQTSLGKPPPQQSGDRTTKSLNYRAAGKILDSGAYVSAVRGGYTTFFTPTFAPAARERLKTKHYFKVGSGKKGDEVSGVKASGKYTKVDFDTSTIGREVSRFFDAASKMYQRGWLTKNPTVKHSDIGPVKIPAKTKVAASPFDTVRALHSSIGPVKMECFGSRDKLDYLWVAEAPEQKSMFNVEHTSIGPVKKDGFTVKHSDVGPVRKKDQNPHCHVLMRWNVEPHLFREWADRLESMWGLGFAKLERIQNANAASGYLLKAINYVLKGGDSDQGEIKGNRYNISSSARAPAWEHIASFDAQNMRAIINEVKEKWQRKDAPIKAVINKAQADLVKYEKAYNIQKATKGRTRAKREITLKKMRDRMSQFEQKIKDGYEQLKQRGVRASEYQISFDSFDKMSTFVGWATSTRYFAAEMLDSYKQDYSEQRAAWGELAKAARDYWKGFGDNGEHAEQLWESRLNAAANHDNDERTACSAYEEYLSMTA